MKKTICLIMATVIAAFTCVPAFADDSYNANVDSIINLDEETMYSQMMAQLPDDQEYLLQEGLIGPESLGISSAAVSTADAGNSSVYYYPTLNMPSAHFYTVTIRYRDQDYTEALYFDKECFKFYSIDNQTIIYVNCDAFDPNGSSKMGSISSDSQISSSITDYLNSGNSSYYYSGQWTVFYADGSDYVWLAVFGTRAFKFEEDEILLEHKAIAETQMGFSGVYAYPNLKLEIENTGSGRRYLGGYYIKGVGANTNITDIAPLIEIGYRATQIVSGGAVANLTFDTVASIFNCVVGLTKSGVLNKTYLSETVPLSNIASDVYAYSCKLRSPFAINRNGAYFQAHIGLNGSDGTSLEYKVTYSSTSN